MPGLVSWSLLARVIQARSLETNSCELLRPGHVVSHTERPDIRDLEMAAPRKGVLKA